MDDNNHIYRVGDSTVTKVTERHLSLKAPTLFSQFDPEVVTEHRPWLAGDHLDASEENLRLSVHTWVARIGGRTILIDTGIGNHKDRPFGAIFHQLDTPFLQRLALVGVSPEDVDLVLHTHLHVDHVGWNTRLQEGRWVPTFPNARYVLPTVEREFYDTDAGASRRIVFEDSVLPVIEAGLTEEIGAQGGEYLPGIRFMPTPGHSPGHMSIEIESAGACTIFTGDVWHHPLQVYRPQWNSMFCADHEVATRSRRWLLDRAAQKNALLFTPHFAGTSAGTVRRIGEGFAWEFL